MKRGIRILRLLGVLAIIAANLSVSIPVYADTEDPDSTPTIEKFNVYHNLLETDDFLLLIYANIPYASLPTEPVIRTFIWQMIDTDNTTVLGSTTGSAYKNKGYGYNIYSMYWNAGNATTLGLVAGWGTEHVIRLSGNPSTFDDPPLYNFALNTEDYTNFTDPDDVKAEMADRILAIATDLNTKWALGTDYYLTLEIETGTVLSIYGEAVFRAAIYGLQGMVPQVFRFVVNDLDITNRTWDTRYSENLTSQWAGTWVETAKEDGATLFSTDYDLLSLIALVLMCFGMIFCGIIVANDPWAGLIDASFVFILGSKLAIYGLGYLGLVTALCMLYVSARMWGLTRG